MKKTRASTSRSKKGCITCKIRHVKCDESIPECLKCTSTGRKCDGYLNVATNAELSLKLTSSYSIPFKVPGSQEHRQLIHYFCVQVASDLSGYINSEFWTHSYLRISHSEPVVQKALVAFSSAKLAMERDSNREAVSNAEVQKKYIKALGGLRKYIAATSKPSVMAVLQCCILFYCFENTRGDHVGALQHLENGLAILRNQRIENKERASLSSNYEDLQEINQVFSRMDLQATLFDDARIPTIEHLPEAVITPSDKLEAWTTLSQACASLDSLANQVANLLTRNVQHNRSSMEDLPSSLLAKQNLVAKFQAWQIAYELLNKRPSTERSKKELEEQVSALHHLKINHQISYLLLQANYPNDPTIFGASPNPAIEEILNLAEALTISHEGRHRVFSAETGIVAPLFLVTLKAGDRALSDRAVQLLMRLNRKEGLHDSKMAADMALEMWKARSMEVGKSVADNDDSLMSCDLPLEVVAADIVELSGGIAAMAEALGVIAHS